MGKEGKNIVLNRTKICRKIYFILKEKAINYCYRFFYMICKSYTNYKSLLFIVILTPSMHFRIENNFCKNLFNGFKLFEPDFRSP